MRYLWTTLLLIFVLAFPASAKSAKRRGGQQSSLSSVRKKPKYNTKPLVYNAKRNRPLVAKKRHWWQKK